MAQARPVPANRANENLSNLWLEGGRKQHYDQAKTHLDAAYEAEAEPRGLKRFWRILFDNSRTR